MFDLSQVPLIAKTAAIAFLMLVHIQFAAFLIGIFGIGATMEFFGVLNPNHRFFDRFAHRIGFTAVVIYSTGAVLAIVFMLFAAIFLPSFWYILFHNTFWPFTLEGMTFVLVAAFLFPWYYTWHRLVGPFKPVHVALAIALLISAQLQQAMIDVVAAYMLTPQSPQELLRLFLNASSLPLDLHRLAGDFSFAGFVIAGYAAVRMLRARDDDHRAYYDWMGSIGLVIGVAFLFIQPAIGVAYVEEIRAQSPGAFDVMMRGDRAWFFLALVVSVSILFSASVWYMREQVRKSNRHGQGLLTALLVIIGLSALLLIQPAVIGPNQYYYWVNWVNPAGTMQPWKYIAFAVMTLAALAALLVYLGAWGRGLRWGHSGPRGRRAQYVLLSLAILTSATMMWMGYIRETSRLPYLVYYRQYRQEPQQFPPFSPTPLPTGAISEGSPWGYSGVDTVSATGGAGE